MFSRLLQRVGDIAGVGQQHAVDGLGAAAGLAQRVAVEVVDDLDAGVPGQRRAPGPG